MVPTLFFSHIVLFALVYLLLMLHAVWSSDRRDKCRPIPKPIAPPRKRSKGFCRKARFLGQNLKIGCQKFHDYRLPSSRKSHFATEPTILTFHDPRIQYEPIERKNLALRQLIVSIAVRYTTDWFLPAVSSHLDQSIHELGKTQQEYENRHRGYNSQKNQIDRRKVSSKGTFRLVLFFDEIHGHFEHFFYPETPAVGVFFEYFYPHP